MRNPNEDQLPEWNEDEIPNFEEMLDELATRAVTEARQRVLDSGRSIVEQGIVDGRTVIMRVSPEGERVVLKEIPPGLRVEPGRKLRLQ